jgi:N-hydroxyarylamine O-acetyltransferase
MDIKTYLARIKYTDPCNLTSEVLARLHKQHVYHIPFENLDIYYKKKFTLSIESVYQKVITNLRGGFCYELNLLFNGLLKELGFSSEIIAARIFNDAGILGPLFDHMAIYVKTEKEFLVDVGYGDLFITPLEIKDGVQYDGRNYFQISKWNAEEYLLLMSTDGVNYQKRYTFSLNKAQAEDFHASCLDKQTNPNSYFVKNVICTKPKKGGRITIFNNQLVDKNETLNIKTPIESEADLITILKDEFGIVL